MLLVVGLGNIGKKYENTRHNIGFLAIDLLVKKYGFSEWKSEKKFKGQIATGQIGDEKVVFLKPDTYMNLSGQAVGALASFYKIKPQDVWALFDDIDLPFGQVRFREKGGSGGHNGLKSLFQGLGSQEFKRIKFGVSNEMRGRIPTDKFVLGKFTPEEQKELLTFIQKGVHLFESSV